MITSINRALAAKREQLKDEDKGFTLIELLVVVLIIGILAAIAIPVFLGQQDAAKDSAVKSDLANAKIAVIAYQVDNPSATSVAINTATLGKYGFTESEFTTYGTTSVSLGSSWTITATSTTGKNFQVTDAAGVTEAAAPEEPE